MTRWRVYRTGKELRIGTETADDGSPLNRVVYPHPRGDTLADLERELAEMYRAVRLPVIEPKGQKS